MDKKLLQAFSEIIREEVLKRNTVKIDGLGIFSFNHRNQCQQQYDDGRVVMMPPKDQIQFIPEQKEGI